ncbi:B30.2/SPRY domain-containing protein [Plasmodiophora brassicae]|uniref:B30.2/SPRY domain-containing protein n=1 Tax=Plasmodiophora brassicae TaxID=37360 RepID=A0A0G4IL25_PLABS|nr:hypothetical protein PBRA_004505 [Plasmodiophora brassicae]SPR00059.1 unnamed protein product [Plasmodiophora brassicae]
MAQYAPQAMCFRSPGHPSYIEVFRDGLSLRFSSTLSQKPSDFVSAIRGSRPIPSCSCNVFYYEVTIVEAGQRGAITIGLADETADLMHRPGVDPSSVGYSATDGKVYSGQLSGKDYGPTFTTNDVVGCGISFYTNDIFFTINGRSLSTACSMKKLPVLFPIIALSSPGELVNVNFGTETFKFDVIAFERDERANQQARIAQSSVDRSLVEPLIQSYLVHHGYHSTYNAFEAAIVGRSDDRPTPSVAVESLPLRRQVIRLICNEDISQAVSVILANWPRVLDSPSLQCELHVLTFVKLVRQSPTMDAIKFAQDVLSRYAGQDAASQTLLNRAMMLLVDSGSSPLTSWEFRESVAMNVNRSILQSLGVDPTCLMTTFLRQLVAVHEAYRDENSKMGSPFNLDSAGTK